MNLRGLFVTDYDGTLLDAQRRVSERNIEAFRRADESGVAVAIVTGRRQSTMSAEHERFQGLSYRVAASNGSVILAPDNRTMERVRALPWSLVDELGARPELLHSPLICITAGSEPPRPPDGPPDCWVLQAGNRSWMRTWQWADASSHRPAEAGQAREQSLVHVALHLATRTEAEALEERLSPHLPEGVEQHVVVAPQGPGALLEIVPRGGKAWALLYFAETLGVPAGATGAIGDEINDLSLCEAAGHAFTVGGSVLAGRLKGATEVGPAAEGAVADAIDEFLARLPA